jgi:hypothetical protein
MATIRPCRSDERPAILAIVNAAADAYRDGFEPVPPERIAPLLRTDWKIPERQLETSVVLAADSACPRPYG